MFYIFVQHFSNCDSGRFANFFIKSFGIIHVLGDFTSLCVPNNSDAVQWALCYLKCIYKCLVCNDHYSDVIMSAMSSQVTGVTSVYSTVCSGANQRKHQSSASLAFARGFPWKAVHSPHKGLVTRKMLSFDDVIMIIQMVCRIVFISRFTLIIQRYSWRYIYKFRSIKH